jgi:branched-chain amino acid transport system ATP-binding protein
MDERLLLVCWVPAVLENLELSAYTKAAKEKKDERLKQIFEIFPVMKERQKQLAGTLSDVEQ